MLREYPEVVKAVFLHVVTDEVEALDALDGEYAIIRHAHETGTVVDIPRPARGCGAVEWEAPSELGEHPMHQE